MTLDEALLQKLAEWQPGAGRQTLSSPDPAGAWAVAVTADRSDALGCLVWELTLRRAAEPAAGETLAAWAERAAGRVTGLLEPLKVLEVDVTRDQALLRSGAPARRGEQVFYYEVILTGVRAAAVRRYRAERQGDARREQVAFALTHEALAKLAADLAATR